MTKPQFSNICVGTQVYNVTTHIHYRVRERIMRTLVLERISPVASAPLVEIAKLSQCGDWDIVRP